LHYDAALDLSTVAASPQTGRSHQLRVHLQLLGFPIHNDVLYGGTSLASTAAAIEAMERTRVTSASAQAPAEATTSTVIANCALCRDGPEASFSAAQLLGPGAAIDLHAVRYRLGAAQSSDELLVQVGLPAWAPASLTCADLSFL
jgi:hypothetical protein